MTTAAPLKARRPRTYAGEAMKPRTVRTTDAQYHKLGRLGGGKWLRAAIEAAEEPAKK